MWYIVLYCLVYPSMKECDRFWNMQYGPSISLIPCAKVSHICLTVCHVTLYYICLCVNQLQAHVSEHIYYKLD